MNVEFERIVQLFRKLPGVGPRQATRFVLSLLERDHAELREFGDSISLLRESVHKCIECGNLTSDDVCSICTDPKRNTAQLMLVEKVTDLTSLERTGIYNGIYHVLGGAISPVDGITPENLSFERLSDRIASLTASRKHLELIVATNPSTAGETTALYIRETFGEKKDLLITRLARGLPTGAHLEYADEMTLRHALEQRR